MSRQTVPQNYDTSNPRLEVSALRYSYPGSKREVLHGLDLKLAGGKLVCLLGANGAGKTTLFKLILGHLKPRLSQGEIHINEFPLTQLTPRELARLMAYIPQIQRNHFSYTVLDMVLMGTTASFSFWSQPGEEAYLKAESALRLLGIESFADRYFDELSGGEQQLVLVARAVAQDTRILIMDEPCSSLDYGNQMRVLRTVKNLAKRGYLVLLSTHTPEHALCFADEVLLMHEGRLLAQGTPAEVMRAELLSRLYRIPLREGHLEADGRRVLWPDLEQWDQDDSDAGVPITAEGLDR